MNKLLIIGGTGLLGQYLVLEAYQRGFEVTATFHDNDAKLGTRSLVHLDVRDEAEVNEVVRSTSPEVVILAAGITDLDRCENNPQEAWAVNAEGAYNVTAACKSADIPMMYISTDAVFNGHKSERYYEFDTPDPLGIYAQTKLEGERLALDADHRNTVARVSLLYGWNRTSEKKNFVTWAIEEMRARRPVPLFTDRLTTPTYAPHCAQVLLKMLRGGSRGIYHVSGPDCMDRFEMGMAIAQEFGLEQSLCQRGSVNDADLAARRGRNLCLSSQKAESEFDLRMMHFRDGIKAMRSTEPGHEPDPDS
ncbi:MAG: SDR family oxidoreductase [Methanomassiliicoccus sp.]|nr:SDR family oxidoreductase [Methanomassiliicoccus sp.]